jgi:hypothetical protein
MPSAGCNLGEYTAGNDKMHMCYAFELLSGQHTDRWPASGPCDWISRGGGRGLGLLGVLQP